MVIWVNSHGGFIVGFILLGIYLVEALFLNIRAHMKCEILRFKIADARIDQPVVPLRCLS